MIFHRIRSCQLKDEVLKYDRYNKNSNLVGELLMDKTNYKYIFDEILRITDDGFIVVDKDGVVIEINDQYCDFLGRKKEDVVGFSILKTISNSKMLEIVNKQYRDEGKIHKFNEGETKDTTNNFLLVNRSCVFNDKNEVIAGVAQVKFRLQTLDSAQKLMREYSELQFYKEEYHKLDANSYTFDGMIGNNKHFLKLKKNAMKCANSDFPILLTGETGTGKEVFAQSIHKNSIRCSYPMICVNCAAIPNALIESEFFGYEEGSFTGAKKGGKIGKFELANNGTIFLDEIGDMPYEMQSKLLRALQEKEIERIGGIKTIKVDVRVIAATRQNLSDMVKAGTFREDLLYRLNVVNIEMIPLRNRRDDVSLFANYFISELNLKYKTMITISEEALKCFTNYNWPGNIRELDNVIKSTYASCENFVIQLSDLPTKMIYYEDFQEDGKSNEKKLKNMVDNFESLIIKDALKNNSWNIMDTADDLGIHRSLLYKKMDRYNINNH
jgi:PAS domain S-box-containing protein